MSVSIDMVDSITMLKAIVLRAQDPTPLLQLLGDMEVARVQERIEETKTDPFGYTWAPWAPRTERNRAQKGNTGQGLLWDTGNLLNSIHYSINGMELDISSDVPYAADLQLGIPGHMWAREFLGWSSDDFSKIRRIAREFLRAMY